MLAGCAEKRGRNEIGTARFKWDIYRYMRGGKN